LFTDEKIYTYTRHKVAENNRQAVKIAVMAGDMSGMIQLYNDLLDLVTKEMPMSRIDDVSRIKMKFEVNLFQNVIAIERLPKI
jgi:beta-glucosidase